MCLFSKPAEQKWNIVSHVDNVFCDQNLNIICYFIENQVLYEYFFKNGIKFAHLILNTHLNSIILT